MSDRYPGFLEALQRHGSETPGRLAFELVGDEGAIKLSYGSVLDRVQRLGEALRVAGMGDGRRVALCLENRPAWPVAYLSVWYAGGVTVPIDPALEPDAIRRVIEHSGAVACVTSLALQAKVAAAVDTVETPPRILNVDGGEERGWDGDALDGGVPVAANVEPVGETLNGLVERHRPLAETGWRPTSAPRDGVATIMYTSGTTGVPKGVMLTHAGIIANIVAGLDCIGVTSEDKLLGVLPLFHSLPLMCNCLGPLHVGAAVTFLSDLNPDRIMAAFGKHEITAFACVPLFFYKFHDRVMHRLDSQPTARRVTARMLLRASRFARRRLGRNLGKKLFSAAHEPFGAKMRLFVTGGAKFDPRVYEDFLDLGFTLVQGYGMTEATAVVSATPYDDNRGDTVGRIVDGVRVRIAEPNESGIGEIVVASPSLMHGYYKNDEATRAVLADGWLSTGDLGWLGEDGHLRVTGRAKDMIVLASGKNIYPEELEDHYGRSPFVEEICIVGIRDPERRDAERLHAVVVPDLDAARTADYVNIREIVTWELENLAKQLPSPQRLTSIELRNEPLPRTTTRKVKRFVLRDEVEARMAAGEAPETHDAAAEGVDGTSSVEVDDTPMPAWGYTARQIIARQAKAEAAHRNDHLDIDLGLDSLDRVEVTAELEATFGVKLDNQAAASTQTVGDVLALLETHLGSEGPEAAVKVADRWAGVLEETPPDIERYLRRRPIGEVFLWILFQAIFLTVRVVAGVRVAGRENLPREFPFMICPNHQSYIDAFLMTAALPFNVYRRVFFVGYAEYFSGWFGGIAARVLRTVPIDQNRNLERAMQAAAEGLRRGMVLGIFPEGGRTIDGAVKEFRRGAAILARHLEVPVVPVGLWGMYEMWPRGGGPRPHRTAIAFGEPLSAGDGPARQVENDLIDRLRGRVLELIERARGLWS